MTDDEVQPWIGKPVRVTLADASIIAGTLHGEDRHDHSHKHYTVVSDPIKMGDDKVKVLIHGAELITDVEDALDDPAAVEYNRPSERKLGHVALRHRIPVAIVEGLRKLIQAASPAWPAIRALTPLASPD